MSPAPCRRPKLTTAGEAEFLLSPEMAGQHGFRWQYARDFKFNRRLPCCGPFRVSVKLELRGSLATERALRKRDGSRQNKQANVLRSVPFAAQNATCSPRTHADFHGYARSERSAITYVFHLMFCRQDFACIPRRTARMSHSPGRCAALVAGRPCGQSSRRVMIGVQSLY